MELDRCIGLTCPETHWSWHSSWSSPSAAESFKSAVFTALLGPIVQLFWFSVPIGTWDLSCLPWLWTKLWSVVWKFIEMNTSILSIWNQLDLVCSYQILYQLKKKMQWIAEATLFVAHLISAKSIVCSMPSIGDWWCMHFRKIACNLETLKSQFLNSWRRQMYHICHRYWMHWIWNCLNVR